MQSDEALSTISGSGFPIPHRIKTKICHPYRKTERKLVVKKKTGRNILLLILLLLGGVVAGWWQYSSGKKDTEESSPITVRVVRRDFSSTVLATGAIKSQVGSEVKVGARVSGKVMRLYANIGDAVKKGQIIAELEKDDLLAKVERNRAELAVTEARIAEVQARLKLADIQYQRQTKLIVDNFTSQDAVDSAEKELAVNQAGLNLARRQMESARAAIKESEANLGYATITAPISGVIASVSTQEGETVAAGLNSPVFVTIVDLKRLQVDAFVDEVDIGKINQGQKVVFTVDSYPAKEFEGRVVAIYPKAVIQENVVNYDVVIDITSSYDGLLKPDMTASVTIMLDARPDVLAVPVESIKRERGKTLLYVLTDGRAEVREVKTGWKDGTWIEIASGVTEGETILLSAPDQAGKTNGGK
jgi:macrolide-specific efflux system membrane fusion protein